jgi:hypothetical protein
MITQADRGGDLQTEIPDGITGLAAFRAMVGSPHRTLIKYRTGPTEVTIEDRMERPACRVVAAQHAMVYRLVSPGALGHDTFFVKVKLISAHDVVGQPAAVDRCNEFDVLFFNFQG